MLCPKGVKRYLQGSHPDRLLTAFQRDGSAARRISAEMPYGDAIRRTATEIGRLQNATERSDRTARRSQPDHRENISARQIRSRLSENPYIDYNGRLCMVSAGRQQESVWHRPNDKSMVGHGRHRRYLDCRLQCG